MAAANADDPQGRQRRRRSVSATAAANADDSSAVAGANDDKAEAEAGTLRGALEAPVARSMAPSFDIGQTGNKSQGAKK